MVMIEIEWNRMKLNETKKPNLIFSNLIVITISISFNCVKFSSWPEAKNERYWNQSIQNRKWLFKTFSNRFFKRYKIIVNEYWFDRTEHSLIFLNMQASKTREWFLLHNYSTIRISIWLSLPEFQYPQGQTIFPTRSRL